jgi:Recombination endonuclease VII
VTGPEYDRVHRTLRRALLAAREPGDRCVRCGRQLPASDSEVDLGHDDERPGQYRGLECAKCNRAAGAAKTNQQRRERQQQASALAGGVAEVAAAVEISHDRRHASLVTAGYLDGDLILVTLASYLDYLDSAALVAAVLALRDSQTVLSVIVDAHSPGATAIRPFEAAKIKVTSPSSSDLATAHGGWIDSLRAGRVRHQGQAELTAAMRHLEARRIGGSTGPERRGAPADVAPAVAAELAVWGLESLVAPPDPFVMLGD